MDSATTSTVSAPLRVMPYSVSNPKTRFIRSCSFPMSLRQRADGDQAEPGRRCGHFLRSSDDARGCARSRVGNRSNGRYFDNVLWIVIDQLEPIFGDVGSWENTVLHILGIKGELQIRFTNSFLLLGRNGPFNRHRFRALNDRGDDSATDKIAAVKRLFAPAAQRDLKKFVFVAARKLPVDKALNQTIDGRAYSISFFGEHTVVRKAIRKIDAVNFPRTYLVRTTNFYFSVDPARA